MENCACPQLPDSTMFEEMPGIVGFGSVMDANVTYFFSPSGVNGLVGYNINEPDSTLSAIWKGFKQRSASPGGVSPSLLPELEMGY